MTEMDKDTLNRTNRAIKKWEKIADGTGVDKGQDNCPLCKKFFNYPLYCKGCPVSKKTGRDSCYGTPYDDWHELVVEDLFFWKPAKISDFKSKRKAIAIAKREVKFLKSLLPKGVKNET